MRLKWCIGKASTFWFLFSVAVASATNVPHCRESLAKLVVAEAAFVKLHHLNYSVASNNQKFIELTEQPFANGMLFVHFENAILKEMNDKILLDKELSASLQALYSRVLMAELEKCHLANPQAIYSDYKSIRMAFSVDTPELRLALSSAYRKAALNFRDEIKKLPGIHSIFKLHGGELSQNPAAWNLGGMGNSADQAALVSRIARNFPPIEVGVPTIKSFRDTSTTEIIMDLWNEQRLWQSKVSELIHTEFGESNKLLVKSPRGKLILNGDLIEIIRKLEGLPEKIFMAEARERINLRFGKVPSVSLITAIRKYLKSANAFSVSVYEIQDQKNLGIGNATEGVVTFDLVGQGNRNFSNLLETLASHNGEVSSASDMEVLLQEIRNAQKQSSKEFESVRNKIEVTLKQSGVSGKVIISGDEIVFVPEKKISANEREFLLEEISAIEPGRTRMSYVGPRYTDTGELLSDKHRFDAMGEAESLEKKLKWELERNGISHNQLKSLSFGIDYFLNSLGQPEIHVRIRPRGNLHLKREDIEKNMLKLAPSAYKISVEGLD